MKGLLIQALRRAAAEGMLASLLSGVALLRGSRTDHAHRVGSLIGAREYRVGRPPLFSRASTVALHAAHSVFWGALYDRVRCLRRRPTRFNACTDALMLTAVAAGIDQIVSPRRLTPSADRAAEAGSKWLLWGGFAAGLAFGGLMAVRQQAAARARLDVDGDFNDDIDLHNDNDPRGGSGRWHRPRFLTRPGSGE